VSERFSFAKLRHFGDFAYFAVSTLEFRFKSRAVSPADSYLVQDLLSGGTGWALGNRRHKTLDLGVMPGSPEASSMQMCPKFHKRIPAEIDFKHR